MWPSAGKNRAEDGAELVATESALWTHQCYFCHQFKSPLANTNTLEQKPATLFDDHFIP